MFCTRIRMPSSVTVSANKRPLGVTLHDNCWNLSYENTHVALLASFAETCLWFESVGHLLWATSTSVIEIN